MGATKAEPKHYVCTCGGRVSRFLRVVRGVIKMVWRCESCKAEIPWK